MVVRKKEYREMGFESKEGDSQWLGASSGLLVGHDDFTMDKRVSMGKQEQRRRRREKEENG